jgi:hypothetical protein
MYPSCKQIQNSEITLERSVPVKLSEGDIRYGAANYKVIGLNCVVGKHATFRLQHISRAKDVVIPITLKYGDQSRTFSYTILGEEAAPAAPVVAAQLVVPESTSVPVLGKSGLMMVVVGVSAKNKAHATVRRKQNIIFVTHYELITKKFKNIYE